MSRRIISPMLVLPLGMLVALAGAYRPPHQPAGPDRARFGPNHAAARPWAPRPAPRPEASRVSAIPPPSAPSAASMSLDDLVRTLRGADVAAAEAAVPGAAGRERAVLAALLADPSWPRGADDPVARAVVEAALWASPDARADLADAIGKLAMARDARAPALLGWVREALRLDSDSPAVVALAREPGRWLDAVEAEAPLGARMSEVSAYFDWPDRPPPEGRKSTLRPLTDAEQRRFEAGERLYAATCAGCHQPTGRGALGIGPPLAGSAIVNGPVQRLGLVLVDGLEGPYRMAGTDFQGVMVPAPNQSDADLAAIMTYVRRAWGNTGEPVTAEDVPAMKRRTRGTAWTRPELDAVRE